VALDVGEVPIPGAGVLRMQESDLEPKRAASTSLYSTLIGTEGESVNQALFVELHRR
jgi:hypothetical protein